MGCLATDKRIVMTANEVAYLELGASVIFLAASLVACRQNQAQQAGTLTEGSLFCDRLARLRLTSSGGPPCFAATAVKRISAQIVEEFVDLA